MATEVRPPAGTVRAPAAARDNAAALLRRYANPLLLTGVVSAVTGLNVLWRSIETRPPHWDMGHHLANSLVYLHGFSLTDPLPFIDGFLFYPPLVYWVTDVFYAVFGNESLWVAMVSNVVWLGVLVFSTYAIGKTLWNPRVGRLAVVFVVTAPMIVSSSKEYMLDMPVTAMTALCLYFLIRAECFARRRYSLLFGAACGCGLLVKWTLPLVLVVPVLHAVATGLHDARVRRRVAPLVNLLGACALALAIAGTWYVHNLIKILGSLSYYSGAEGVVQGNPRVGTPASVYWYLWDLFNDQLYLVPFLMFGAGVVFCFRRRAFASRNLFPILTIVGGYVVLTLLRHKDARYSLPLLPAVAIVATSWLEYVSARARKAISVAFAVYGAAAFLAISFGTSVLPKSVTLPAPWASFGHKEVTLFAQHGYVIGPPTHEQWHQEDLFRTIARFPEAERRFAYSGADTVWFNKHGLNYFALRYDADWANARRARFHIRRGAARATPHGWTSIESWPLPDGGVLALYERD